MTILGILDIIHDYVACGSRQGVWRIFGSDFFLFLPPVDLPTALTNNAYPTGSTLSKLCTRVSLTPSNKGMAQLPVFSRLLAPIIEWVTGDPLCFLVVFVCYMLVDLVWPFEIRVGNMFACAKGKFAHRYEKILSATWLVVGKPVKTPNPSQTLPKPQIYNTCVMKVIDT